MFFRFHTTSILVRTLVAVFALTLFLDATDIVDLFSQSVVMHGDSDEDAQIQGSSIAFDLQATAKAKTSVPLTREVREIVLDQDSPSLAADVVPMSVSGFIFSPAKTPIPCSANREQSLVRLCVLRI